VILIEKYFRVILQKKIEKNTMKKLFFTLLIIVPFISFAQDTYTFKSGGRIFQNDREIAPDAVRGMLLRNQPALALYEAGRTKKTLGNVLLYGGLATLTGKLLLDLTTDTESTITYGNYNTVNVDQKRSTPTAYIIGGIMLVAAIPIKIGFSKKIKKAVSLMNEAAKKPETSFIESSSLVMNQNGVGISITF
jgi:hypothetical protein